MSAQRYYYSQNIGYYYIVMDSSNDRKIAECYFKEDAELVVKALNRLDKRRNNG